MHNNTAIRVIEPGMLTTVQDLGRSGWTEIGVARGGAADTLSLRAGNRLIGNSDGDAALEMTLTGGTFEFRCDTLLILTGGEVSAQIDGRGGKRSVAAWAPFEICAGEQLSVGPVHSGVRSYLCVAGGILVPTLLGSRSTHLAGSFGGLDGRALRKDDTLEVGDAGKPRIDLQMAARARAFSQPILQGRTLRAVDGAHQCTFDPRDVASFWQTRFEVSMQSDRTGLRLTGRIGPSTSGGRMPSEGMMPGAIQVPQSGEPIVLMVDHPTTGGYPVIACVAAVDHAALGQLRPREWIQFERITCEEARKRFTEQEQRFNEEVPPR